MFRFVPIFLFCFGWLALEGAINSEGDFQIWNDVRFTKELSPHFKFYNSTEWRFGSDASKAFYVHEEMGIIIEPRYWISLMPAYRQIWIRSATEGWSHVYNPLFDLWFRLKKRCIEIGVRHRVQYLILTSDPNLWQYRFLTRISFPFLIKGHTYSLFAHEELFFLQNSGYAQNRVVTGVITEINSYITLNLHYARRYLKDVDGWVYNNILGIYANFNF